MGRASLRAADACDAPAREDARPTKLRRSPFAQPRQQLAVDAVKAAVAKDADDIPTLRVLREVCHDGVGVRQIRGFLAGSLDVRHQFFGIQALVGGNLLQPRHFGHDHGIRIGKGRHQLVLKHIPARGVATRLEHGPDFFFCVTQAQRLERLANGRGMMAKIINHRHAARDALHFQPALDALEGVESTLDLFVRQTAVFRRADDGERVADIQLTDHVQVELEAGNLKCCRRRAEAQIETLHGIAFDEAEALHRTVRDVQQLSEVRIVAIAEQQAVARHEADEVAERFLHRVEIVEDVRVVEFQIVDDGDLRLVMDELAALVEKRGVVFVALDDEPFAVREPCALRKIVRDAADEIARVQAVVLEHPRQQRGRGGFAVRAGDDERAFAPDEKLRQQRRQRAIAQLVVEHIFRLRVAAGNGVADDDEVRLVLEVLLCVTVHHGNFLSGEERRHRLIDILIGTGDGKTFIQHRGGGGRHRRAANAGEMNGFDLG